MTFTVKRLDAEEEQVVPLLRYMADKALKIAASAEFPVDFDRATQNIWIIFQDGAVYAAYAESGEIVGTVGLRKSPVTFFTPADYLCYVDEWVLGEDGAALAILKKAKEDIDLPIFIRRIRWDGKGLVGDIASVNVVGRVIRLG